MLDDCVDHTGFYSVLDTNVVKPDSAPRTSKSDRRSRHQGCQMSRPEVACSNSPSLLVNELWQDVIDPTDDRHPLWAEQRATRGFDDTDLWSLDQTIARFLVSRLKAFRDCQGVTNVPHALRPKLDDVIIAFETIVERGDGSALDEDDQILIKKGFKRLRQIFFQLFI